MSKHTPGPWSVTWGTAQGGEGHHIMDSTGIDNGLSIVAVVGFHDDSEGETKANARLIAAAPDLLAALKMALEAPDDDRSWEDDAIAAIKKADPLWVDPAIFARGSP